MEAKHLSLRNLRSGSSSPKNYREKLALSYGSVLTKNLGIEVLKTDGLSQYYAPQMLRTSLIDPHVDAEILSRLDGRSLVLIGRVNSYFRKLTEIDDVWVGAIMNDYGQDIPQYIPQGQYRSTYRKLATVSVTDASMVEAIRDDHVALVKYLLSQGIKIRMGPFWRHTVLERLPSDFFQIIAPHVPTPDYIAIIIGHDSVGVWTCLAELGLFPDVSFLQEAVPSNALKITERIWQHHPDFDPNTIAGPDWTLDMLKWWAEPPRNWKPRS